MKYLSQLNKKYLNGKTCLLRLDLNIQDDELKNSLRLKRASLTINFLLKNNVKVIILSHKGRPENVSNIEHQKSKLSLKDVSKALSDVVDKKIILFENFDFKKIKKAVNDSNDKVFMLENLRFNSGEENNSKNFAKGLSFLGDFYVNDAFAVSHRENASVCAITDFLPSYAGLELEMEIKAFEKVIKNPPKPLIIILGGAKISDKIGVIKKFYSKISWVLTGGGVANTFFAAKNIPVGKSLYDKNSLTIAKEWSKSKKIIFPQDVKIENGEILDIGKKTIENYSSIIKKAKTIIWNGPMGYIENEKYQNGTVSLARAIGKSRDFSIVGGGETTSLILKKHLEKNIKFLSIGGGAMLWYLSGKKMPGLEALDKNNF